MTKFTAIFLVAAIACAAVVQAHVQSGQFNVSIDHFQPQNTEQATFVRFERVHYV